MSRCLRRLRSHSLSQTFRVGLLPAASFPITAVLISGPLSSNYCTLMAGPITSRLIVWSLPYVQSAVMLIRLSTHAQVARGPAAPVSLLVHSGDVCQGEFSLGSSIEMNIFWATLFYSSVFTIYAWAVWEITAGAFSNAAQTFQLH